MYVALYLGAIVAAEASGDAGTNVLDGITIANRYADIIATFEWHGDIAEIIIYDSNLSNADKNQVGEYAEDRYNITWTTIS